MSRRITQRRRRRKKGRRRQRRRANEALVLANKRRKLKLRPGALEIARGYDGLLRGHPEPVLLLAAYDARPDRLRLLSRSVTRYERVKRLPAVLSPRELRVKGVHIPRDLEVLVLAIAVEEDSSRDIQALFADLDRADDIVGWPSAAPDGIPGGIDQMCECLRCERVEPVEIKVGGRFPSDWFRADDYIAAAAVWLRASGRRSVAFEFPARSADGRNDWLARVDLELR